MNAPIKIFRVNDCDWYAAESLEEALEELAQMGGEEALEEAREFGPRELTEEELDSHLFTDEDTQEERPFREQLALMVAKGERFPQLFASTEF